MSIILCVFNPTIHGAGKAGFLNAKNNKELFDAEVHLDDCSSSVMYSVLGMADAVARCLGGAVEIGVYRETSNDANGGFDYASMDEIETESGEDIYTSLLAGFEAVLTARKNTPLLVSRAITMLGMLGWSDISELKVSALIKIGRNLNKLYKSPKMEPLTYDDERALWVGTPDQTAYRPRSDDGSPDFSKPVR